VKTMALVSLARVSTGKNNAKHSTKTAITRVAVMGVFVFGDRVVKLLSNGSDTRQLLVMP
jgi:hypothetical protein